MEIQKDLERKNIEPDNFKDRILHVYVQRHRVEIE